MNALTFPKNMIYNVNIMVLKWPVDRELNLARAMPYIDVR